MGVGERERRAESVELAEQVELVCGSGMHTKQLNSTADSLELLSSRKRLFTVVKLEGNLKQICSPQLFSV